MTTQTESVCDDCGGNGGFHFGWCGDQMAAAVHRQMAAAQRSAWIDRRGWTQEQWIEDADRLMNEIDGAITSLVNGHVMTLLDYWRASRQGDPRDSG